MYEIYGAPGCAGCVASESYLKARKLPYVKKTVAELMKIMPEAKSIPQIFRDGEHIGQFDDMVLRIKAGL